MDEKRNNDNLEELIWKNLDLEDLNKEDAVHMNRSSLDKNSLNEDKSADNAAPDDHTIHIDRGERVSKQSPRSKQGKSSGQNKASSRSAVSNQNKVSKKMSTSNQHTASKKSPASKKQKSGKKKSTSPAKSISNLIGNIYKGGSSLARGTIRTTGTVAKSAFRLLTLGLIILTMVLLGYHFWQNHFTLGSLNSIVHTENYSLAVFLGIGAFLLLFELLAFWRASTSIKVLEDGHLFRYDTGRGLCSFPIIYLGSLLANHYASLVPTSPAVLVGVQAALRVYGSMRGQLLTICVLGIVCCLICWFSSKIVIAARHSQDSGK